MATEQDLHQAFINFSYNYLNVTESGDVDVKMVDIISKYLDKKKFDALPDQPDGSFEADKVDALQVKLGVK